MTRWNAYRHGLFIPTTAGLDVWNLLKLERELAELDTTSAVLDWQNSVVRDRMLSKSLANIKMRRGPLIKLHPTYLAINNQKALSDGLTAYRSDYL